MSIQIYLLIIIVLLLAAMGLVRYTFRTVEWLPCLHFSSRLKSPQKRAILHMHETKNCLRHLHKQFMYSHKTPQLADEIVWKLRRLLPLENILLKEQTRLYSKLKDIKASVIPKSHRYGHHAGYHRHHHTPSISTDKLIKIHHRIDGLEHEAKELQNQISTLLHLAEKFKTAQHYSKLAGCLKTAEKMQQENIKLLKKIHNTEKDLIVVSKKLDQHGKAKIISS